MESDVVNIDGVDMTVSNSWTSDSDLHRGVSLGLRRLEYLRDVAEDGRLERCGSTVLASNGIGDLQVTLGCLMRMSGLARTCNFTRHCNLVLRLGTDRNGLVECSCSSIWYGDLPVFC